MERLLEIRPHQERNGAGRFGKRNEPQRFTRAILRFDGPRYFAVGAGYGGGASTAYHFVHDGRRRWERTHCQGRTLRLGRARASQKVGRFFKNGGLQALSATNPRPRLRGNARRKSRGNFGFNPPNPRRQSTTPQLQNLYCRKNIARPNDAAQRQKSATFEPISQRFWRCAVVKKAVERTGRGKSKWRRRGLF